MTSSPKKRRQQSLSAFAQSAFERDIMPTSEEDVIEVKKDVVEEFWKLDFSDIGKVVLNKKGNFHINLYEANKQILLKSGIKEENIITSDVCTMCNKGLLFSHRASGEKRGGMLAMMSLRG